MNAQENNSFKLWYKTPAANWNEALPAGNGRLGAMVFGRVSLQLVELDLSGLPTNTRLDWLRKGNSDPQLFALYFQYGRYLLMSSSRKPGVLPANLQGIWNNLYDARRNSDLQSNINLQMKYWSAEVCILSETAIR